MNFEKRVESFDVEDEAGGRFTVDVFQEFIDASTLQGQNWIPGRKRMVLDGGEPCRPGPEEGLILGLDPGKKYWKV